MNRFLDIWKRLRRGPVAVLVCALALAAVLIGTRPERPRVEMPERAWSVAVMPAVTGAIRPTLELYGRVESPEDASLSAAVEADVMEVLVQDGDTVEPGAMLVVLDDSDVRLELLQRDADVQEIAAQISLEKQRRLRNSEALDKERELLQLSENNTARARSLYAEKLLSLANVDDSAEQLKRQQLAVTSRQLAIEESVLRIRQLKAQLLRAEALRDRARLNLDRARVKAPFAGAISEVDVSVGDRVRVGDSLMRLHNPAKVELRTQVPSRFATRIRRALAENIEISAIVDSTERSYPARLERISRQTRQGSGSVDAFLIFGQPPETTRLGATVRVLLSLPAEAGAIAVPAEALYGRNRLYVVDGERMAAVDVERIGERLLEDGRSEVIVRSDELTADDLIITTKVSTAADGLLVSMHDEQSARAASMLASRDARAGAE